MAVSCRKGAPFSINSLLATSRVSGSAFEMVARPEENTPSLERTSRVSGSAFEIVARPEERTPFLERTSKSSSFSVDDLVTTAAVPQKRGALLARQGKQIDGDQESSPPKRSSCSAPSRPGILRRSSRELILQRKRSVLHSLTQALPKAATVRPPSEQSSSSGGERTTTGASAQPAGLPAPSSAPDSDSGPHGYRLGSFRSAAATSTAGPTSPPPAATAAASSRCSVGVPPGRPVHPPLWQTAAGPSPGMWSAATLPPPFTACAEQSASIWSQPTTVLPQTNTILSQTASISVQPTSVLAQSPSLSSVQPSSASLQPLIDPARAAAFSIAELLKGGCLLDGPKEHDLTRPAVVQTITSPALVVGFTPILGSFASPPIALPSPLGLPPFNPSTPVAVMRDMCTESPWLLSDWLPHSCDLNPSAASTPGSGGLTTSATVSGLMSPRLPDDGNLSPFSSTQFLNAADALHLPYTGLLGNLLKPPDNLADDITRTVAALGTRVSPPSAKLSGKKAKKSARATGKGDQKLCSPLLLSVKSHTPSPGPAHCSEATVLASGSAARSWQPYVDLDAVPSTEGPCLEAVEPSYGLLLQQMKQLIEVRNMFAQHVDPVTDSSETSLISASDSGVFPMPIDTISIDSSGTFPMAGNNDFPCPAQRNTIGALPYLDMNLGAFHAEGQPMGISGEHLLLGNSGSCEGLANPTLHHDSCRLGFCPHINEQVKKRERRQKRKKFSQPKPAKRNPRAEVKTKIQESIRNLFRKKPSSTVAEKKASPVPSFKSTLLKRAQDLLQKDRQTLWTKIS